MRKIKDVLVAEIDQGLVNWDKLSAKLHAALQMVGNDFESITAEGQKVNGKFSDEITFRIKKSKFEVFCYKLIEPRFRNGELWCTGLQVGTYNQAGRPIFHQEAIRF